MPTLKFKGESYNGDGIKAVKDEPVPVSAAKGAQLMADFPNDWEIIEGEKEIKAVKSPKNKMQKNSGKNKSK